MGPAWELFAYDYFDRDADLSLQCRGEGLEAALTELWRRILDEGVMDDGRPTFTWFLLHGCEGASVDVPRGPLENPALGKLRRWWLKDGTLLSPVVRAHLAHVGGGGARRVLAVVEQAADEADLRARLGRA